MVLFRVGSHGGEDSLPRRLPCCHSLVIAVDEKLVVKGPSPQLSFVKPGVDNDASHPDMTPGSKSSGERVVLPLEVHYGVVVWYIAITWLVIEIVDHHHNRMRIGEGGGDGRLVLVGVHFN